MELLLTSFYHLDLKQFHMDTEDKDFGVIAVIPREIILSDKISSTSKILYAMVTGLCRGKRKECFASDRYFMKYLGISRDMVQKSLKELEKSGFINRVIVNSTRYIRITWKAK